MPKRLTIGLTGGVASGKSAAGDAFEALGITVVDADRLARDAVQPGQPALDDIRKVFGDAVFQPDGALDRRLLRALVFEDGAARERLEVIVHPHVRAALGRAREGAHSAYVVLMVPLLVESGLDRMTDRVLVVDVPENVQIARLIARDEIDEPLARQMLAAQATRRMRLDRADDVLVNTGTLDDLRQRVARLHRDYLKLADGEVDSLPKRHLPASGQ